MQLQMSPARRPSWMDILREHQAAAIGVLLALALTLAVLLVLGMTLEPPERVVRTDAPAVRESRPASNAEDAPSVRATYAFGS